MINQLMTQLKPWLAWLHLHPYWAGLAVFLVCFAECLVLVGLVVPGTVIMTVIGALIGSKVIPAETVFIAGGVGCLAGDMISFFIGYHYREHLRDLWPFKFYPKLLQKGENFFYRHGGKGVFLGRFIGPIRPMLPIIAGMLNMPPWRFFIADGSSAVFWAPIVTLPGILLGAASAQLPPDLAMRLMLYVILSLLVLWCISWVIKRFIQWVFASLHRLLDMLWGAIKHTALLRPLHIALQDPLHPDGHAQLTLALYFILMLGLFGILGVSAYQQGYFTHWNTPVWYFMRSLYQPMVYHIFLVITLISDTKVQLGVSCVMLLFFLVQRTYRVALHWGLLILLTVGATEVLKLLTHSLRPWGLQVIPPGYSFPSGHTTFTVVFCGFLAILLSREITRKTYRGLGYIFAVILALSVGFSRVYLGAHWLTDVIGGILLGLVIVMFVTLSYRRKYTPKLNPVLISLVFVFSWALIGSIYAVKNYGTAVFNYRPFTPSKILTMNSWWDNNGLNGPHYRLNRLGKPAQVLNLEWAGNLSVIEKNLAAKGWRSSPSTTLETIITRMNASPTMSLSLPVVLPLYLDQRPALMMTKSMGQAYKNSLLILTVWDSRARFSDVGVPLWIGNISYYHVWDTGYIHLHPNKIEVPSQSAVNMLKNDLASLSSEEEGYITKDSGQVLLIKEIEGK